MGIESKGFGGKLKPTQWIGCAVLVVLLFLCTATSGSIHDYYWRLASQNWPMTDATVTGTEWRGRGNQHPFLDYTYSVSGKQYSSFQKLSMAYSLPKAKAEFPRGKHISVRYDPNSPNVSWMPSEVFWFGLFLDALMLVLFILGAGFLLVRTIRAKR